MVLFAMFAANFYLSVLLQTKKEDRVRGTQSSMHVPGGPWERETLEDALLEMRVRHDAGEMYLARFRGCRRRNRGGRFIETHEHAQSKGGQR